VFYVAIRALVLRLRPAARSVAEPAAVAAAPALPERAAAE